MFQISLSLWFPSTFLRLAQWSTQLGMLTQNWSKLEKWRTRCDIVKLPKVLRDLCGREMKKTKVEKTNQEFSPSSYKLNVKTTMFKEKFTSWQPLCRMALAGPPPALLAPKCLKVLLP